MADLLGLILKSMENPPTVDQAARMKKMQQDEKEKERRMEKEVPEFIQASRQPKRKFNSMGKIERSILHDVAEDEFAPSDDELEAYQNGMEWDPQKAVYRRRLKEQAALEEETAKHTQKRAVSPSSNYRDKYSHLIGTSAAKDTAHTVLYSAGPSPDVYQWPTKGLAMNEIRAKKRQKTGAEDTGAVSSTTS
uniref:Sperm associated antigen 7 n=1 Tax=Oncorhynchus kisutch TaxID=8019 RepID=A0A8C7L9Q1_ONCKI